MMKHSTTILLHMLLLLCQFYHSVHGFTAFLQTAPAVGRTNKVKQVLEASINNNFQDWISDAPNETSKKQLNIEGSIPTFLNGYLIRNGGAKWSNGDQMNTHIFDGLAKISMYQIIQSDDQEEEEEEEEEKDDNDNDDHQEGGKEENQQPSIYFQTKFIKSNWYHKVHKSKGIPASISIGPITNQITKQKQTGPWQSLMAIVNAIQFDNPCVNIWNYNSSSLDQVTAITDAPPRAQIAIHDLSTISSSPLTPSTSQLQGYELFCTTHPEYSKMEKGTTYNVGVEIGLGTTKVILTKETSLSRIVVARSDSIEGIPYIHSFGVNGQYATVVLQPLRGNLDIGRILNEGYFSVMDHLDYTQIIVFDLDNGNVVLDQRINEKIYFYHTISAAEELCSDDVNNDSNVSIRICGYKVPDIITGEDQFMKLDQCTGPNGKQYRNRISKGGTICDIICYLKTSKVEVQWKDEIKQGFELPTTRYSRSSGSDALRSQHPRYIYAYSAFANGSDEYDAWGLYKFDMDKNCIDSYYQQDSRYVSEPIFVPDPNGSSEDDGVILSQVYDGNRRETALLVLNAKNMEVLATAWTGQRSAMDFHGTFISQ